MKKRKTPSADNTWIHSTARKKKIQREYIGSDEIISCEVPEDDIEITAGSLEIFIKKGIPHRYDSEECFRVPIKLPPWMARFFDTLILRQDEGVLEIWKASTTIGLLSIWKAYEGKEISQLSLNMRELGGALPIDETNNFILQMIELSGIPTTKPGTSDVTNISVTPQVSTWMNHLRKEIVMTKSDMMKFALAYAILNSSTARNSTKDHAQTVTQGFERALTKRRWVLEMILEKAEEIIQDAFDTTNMNTKKKRERCDEIINILASMGEEAGEEHKPRIREIKYYVQGNLR